MPDDELRIERVDAGSFEQAEDGRVHRKIIPFAIIVQPVRGWQGIEGRERRLRIDAGEIAVVTADCVSKSMIYRGHAQKEPRLARLHGYLKCLTGCLGHADRTNRCAIMSSAC